MSGSPTTITTEASYRTLLTLAIGGMGQVDLAIRREANFERLFAIKRLRPELSDEPDVRAMFLDESRIAGLIRHPNVVSIVDLGEDDAGPFAVMEFVDGISVSQLLSNDDVQPLPMELALRIGIQVAEGLHAAHEWLGPDGNPLELVHRDVSPQNILLGFDGIARVTDFGVAKAVGRISKTSTGVLKGKLGYISPEQLRFEEPDRRADLFSLGVVLFELLTGQRLYRSQDGMDGPRRILTEPPPDLADYRDDAEPELVQLMFELLAKNREARPATAMVVARRLEAILAGLTTGGPTVDTIEFLAEHFHGERRELAARIAEAGKGLTRRAPPRSRKTLIIVGAVVSVLIAGVAGWKLASKSQVVEAAGVEPVAAFGAAQVNEPARATEAAPRVVEAVPGATASSARPGEPAESNDRVPTLSAEPVSAPAPASKNRGSQPRAKSKSEMPIWEKY